MGVNRVFKMSFHYQIPVEEDPRPAPCPYNRSLAYFNTVPVPPFPQYNDNRISNNVVVS